MNKILHLGLGRFHRGHQAVFYQHAGDWKVISSTMRSPDEKNKLKKAGLSYPVLELSHEEEKLTWIDCIEEALSLNEDLPRLLALMASPEIKIITLTVTEKGYCLNSTGELDLNHPGIQHDLKNPDHPETAIGLLSLGLSRRKESITVISCDNLRENGKKLKTALMTFNQSVGRSLPPITFPNTMVDRIVPALLPEKISELETRHQLSASELIATEKFSQWVIEDKFAGTRPDWNKVGVQFVNDVRPYEEMKLRLLNASHSYLAYAGLNRGFSFVHEAIADKTLLENVRHMMKVEVIPLLTLPSGFDIQKYTDDLIFRFRNDKLPHQLKQIAMDGSQKMPQRIFSSIHEAREANRSHDILLKVTDEWLNFLWNSREGKIDDPKASDLLSRISLGKEAWKKQLLDKLL
ncbi:MAG: mannitol dehydrogenase family protein [Bdellovibrionota bacterium]